LHRETRSMMRAAAKLRCKLSTLPHGRPGSGWIEKTTKSTGPLSLAWANPPGRISCRAPQHPAGVRAAFLDEKPRNDRCATMFQEIHTTRKENHASNGY
jgi:hypothetical protein